MDFDQYFSDRKQPIYLESEMQPIYMVTNGCKVLLFP